MKPGKRILIIGLAMIALAAVLQVILPVIGYAIWNPSSPPGQDILVVMEVVIRLVAAIVPALGAALTAAGIILMYLERHIEFSRAELRSEIFKSETSSTK